MLHAGRRLIIVLAAALQACSPALNWREVRFEGSGPLRMLLPCKPDRAERPLTMAGHAVALQMIGCDADGATFAVSQVHAADGAAARILLDGWKAAVLAHVRAEAVQTRAWDAPGNWAGGRGQRVHATAHDATGQPLVLEAVWFGVPRAEGVDLFHAVMFSPRSRTETADTFFAGMATAP